jgi:hypothetical protein
MDRKYKDPAIWMIRIKDNKASEAYSSLCLNSWKNAKLTVNMFDAITPETMPEDGPLNFGIKRSVSGKRPFTETEKAVWYSHFNLWKDCTRKSNPMLVIEHDAMLLKDPKHAFLLSERFPIVCLSHCGILSPSPQKRWNRPSPGCAYIITPWMAKRLVRDIPNEIDCNSDGYLANYMTNLGAWVPHYVTQFYHPNLGTTIDHPKSEPSVEETE